MNVTCPHCGTEFSTGTKTILGDVREAKGLSLRAVSEKVGVSIRELSRIERGISSQPRLDVARKIAAVYGSTIDELWPSSPDAPMELEAVEPRVVELREVEIEDEGEEDEGSSVRGVQWN